MNSGGLVLRDCWREETTWGHLSWPSQVAGPDLVCEDVLGLVHALAEVQDKHTITEPRGQPVQASQTVLKACRGRIQHSQGRELCGGTELQREGGKVMKHS